MKKPAKKSPAKKTKDPFHGVRKVVIFPHDTKWADLRDDEIAEKLGCSPNTVFRYRKANNHPRGPRKAGSGAQPRIDPAKINMNKTAMENAEKHGCSYGWMLHLMAERRAAEATTAKAPASTKVKSAVKKAAKLW